MSAAIATKPGYALRVIENRRVCAGDCPLWHRLGAPGQGLCMETHRQMRVGELCHAEITCGGTRYAFACFSANPRRRRREDTPHQEPRPKAKPAAKASAKAAPRKRAQPPKGAPPAPPRPKRAPGATLALRAA